ncbi:vacuolar er assembly vma12 [Fusarium tjaetaba]|uniref:Vacuolar er assembly vma12 n=1 Tax=Fusarium tjaetaba TaxID=1567544 RepID=A0A8H5W4K0_9HYPO|nr:vacuolar er assembly vma12 [Fusarium tjaetaba]KAF5646681.1 vacuolar er assembly vma12 [Fusarium tjaetaba]
MTSSILEALSTVEAAETPQIEDHDETEEEESQQPTQEPTLDDPKLGNPISHGQVVDLWKQLKAQGNSNFTLEQLLRGASVYIPPPPPKPEPSPEYKALMARLRREEEARSYERMINPPPQHETFKDHFPSITASFAAANRPTSASDLGDDDMAMEEVHKQITLIINFLVSIAGVAGTLWVTARWWSLPAHEHEGVSFTNGNATFTAHRYRYRGLSRQLTNSIWSYSYLDNIMIMISSKSTGIECASPAPSVPRSRVKPLRTYGKRSIRDDSPKEPNTKKRRVSTESTAPEPASKGTDKAPLKEVTEEAKNIPESTTTNKPTTEPVKKGSILNFFKPVPPSSTVTSSPKSDDPQPESTPPSSPPQPPKIEPRKKPRLLRFRGTSTPLLDEGNTGDDSQGEDTKAEDAGTKSARPAAQESSLNRDASTNDTKPGKKGKAAFSECKVCNTVWNPLYPDDVKFHAKQHAAVLRAKRKEKESEL